MMHIFFKDKKLQNSNNLKMSKTQLVGIIPYCILRLNLNESGITERKASLLFK